jgi:hypothetical protein
MFSRNRAGRRSSCGCSTKEGKRGQASSIRLSKPRQEWRQPGRRSRRRGDLINLIIRGACQETEEEDDFKRKAHDIAQVVMIAKIKCPEYKEEEVREMILQVKREGACNPEQKFCPMKVVLKEGSEEFQKKMLQSCHILHDTNQEMGTMLRVQENVTKEQAARYLEMRAKAERLTQEAKEKTGYKYIVIGGRQILG